ncbi:MAG: c-type cytochrome [Bacteroidia bacterium]
MHKPDPGKERNHMATVIHRLLLLVSILTGVIAVLLYVLLFGMPHLYAEKNIRSPEAFSSPSAVAKNYWKAPDTLTIQQDPDSKRILYGQALIRNTALYLGPRGSVSHTTNGMNCQNCHLDAGTRPFGNNFSAVASTYPKFRERSGKTENIYKRVNDCLERSLNGSALDTLSAEMQAIKAYICWLGKDVKKGVKPAGSGIEDLPFMDRSADPEKGKTLFVSKCVSCHGADGQGKLNPDGMAYQYPPLWGAHSYNDGAGLYRLTRFAGYIRNNMPYGATHELTQLSNEEAWDIAAYVNSMPRPAGDIKSDWPRLGGKPVDNPFGPYADPFSVQQHRYGPYAAIKEWNTKHQQKKPK